MKDSTSSDGLQERPVIEKAGDSEGAACRDGSAPISSPPRKGGAWTGRRTTRSIVVLLAIALLAAVGPTAAHAAGPPSSLQALCDDLGLAGCGGSIASTLPTESGSLLGASGLELGPSSSGGLSGGLLFEGPRGGPGGLGIAWDGSGDGDFGVGFSLVGVPRIDRCAPSMLMHGVSGADVGYDLPIADAVWCLNGVPLEDVLGNGTEYRSMVENGIIVRREGGASWLSPNAHFVLYGRDGSKIRFDRRIGGTTVFSFLPTALTDASSNTMNYEWTVNQGVETGPMQPWIRVKLTRVSWGGNEALGTADEFHADLNYLARPHPIESFAGGVKFVTDERIGWVSIERFGTPGAIRVYNFSYLPSSDFDPRSYLKSVRVCEEWGVCTEPTELIWDNVKTDGEAFAASPQPQWFPAFGEQLESPYEVGRVGPMRAFRTQANGTVSFGWKSQPSAPFEELALGGPVGSTAVEFREGISNTIDVDVFRFVTDRSYFFGTTSCSDLTPVPDGNNGLQVCGATMPHNPHCSGIGHYSPNDVYLWPVNQVDHCLGIFDDYAKNELFEVLLEAYGAQLTGLVVSARLEGDFDCDGLNDEWVTPNVFGGPSDTSFGAGTAPGFNPTETIPLGWDLSTVQFGPKKFWKYLDGYVRSLADAYSGLVVADFDGDCFADIYQMYGEGSAADRLYLGDGAGGFSLSAGPITWLQDLDAGWITTNKESARKMRVRASDKSRFRFGHFNNDNLIDVAYVNGWIDNFDAPPAKRSPVSVHLNNGDGTWSTVFDGPALVVREPMETSSNNTPNALALTNRDIAAVQIADLNADRCSDLFVLPRPTEKNAPSSGKARIFYSHCDGSFDLEHSATVDVGPQLWFEGRDKHDGRSLGAFQVVVEDDQGNLPEEVELLWQHDLAVTASVRLADFNGDGLADIYEIDDDGRDRVWLNMGGTDFAEMNALSYPVGNFPNGANATWDIDSQLGFDLSRLSPVTMASGELPGMWVGGHLSVNQAGHWTSAPERFYESGFSLPRLVEISDGLGNTTQFEWATHRELTDPLAVAHVVTAVESTTPATAGGAGVVDITHRTEYRYKGLSVDPVYGSLGWASVTMEQVAPGGDGLRRVDTEYWQNDPRTVGTHSLAQEWVMSGGSWVKVAESANRVAVDWLNDPDFGDRAPLSYRIVPDSDCTTGWGTRTTWRLDGTVASHTCTEAADPDIWGNLDWTRTSYLDGSSVEVRNSFGGSNSGSTEATMRYHGLSTTEETIITGWDGDVQTALAWTAYDLTHLKPKVHTVPGPNGQQIFAHIYFTANGNVREKRTGGNDIDTVIETHTYLDHTVPETVTKIVGGVAHQTQTVFGDRTLETPTTVIDINGSEFHSSFDGAGRLVRTSGDGIHATDFFYGVEPTVLEQQRLGGLWADWEVPEVGGASYSVYDRTGRVVRVATQNPIGWSVVDTYYDVRGASTEVSRPFISTPGEPNARDHLDVVNTYDAFGRVTSATTAAGLLVETHYDNAMPPLGLAGPYYQNYPPSMLRTTSTTVDGVPSWVTSDLAGRTVAVINAEGRRWWSDYDPSGNLIAESDLYGNETRWVFDSWGRLVQTVDPDFGTTTMSYDAGGNLKSTEDNLGNRTEMTYDPIGRLVESSVVDQFNKLWEQVNYTYDTAPGGGLGMLAAQSSKHETRTFTYTAIGQPETVTRTLTVDGVSESATTTAYYDPLGRNYRNKINGRWVQNTYDANTGAVIEIFDSNSGNVYWKSGGYDAQGRLALVGYGNGTADYTSYETARDVLTESVTYDRYGNPMRSQAFTWDAQANLTQRDWDNHNGITHSESFGFDTMQRLETVTTNNGPTQTRSYTPINNLAAKGADTYHYDETNGAGPNTPNRVGDRYFDYDANGNLFREQQPSTGTGGLPGLSEKEAAEKEAAEKEAAEKEAAEKEAADKEAAEKEAADKEAADKEAAEKEAADKEAAEKEAADKEAADKEAAEKEAAEKEAAEKEAAEKEAAEKEAETKTGDGPDLDPKNAGGLESVAFYRWTPHNKIDIATRWSSPGQIEAQLQVQYGLEAAKIRQSILDKTANTRTTTWYLASSLRHVDVDGDKREEFDVVTPTGVVATISRDADTGAETTSYRHVDHLGSPVHYTDGTGAVTVDLAYNADGATRDAATWVDLDFGDTGDNPLEVGFGGHDGLELFGLNNLGARLYDQHRGQFIQPDTVSSELRYGYANNNPLSFTDPDGNNAVGVALGMAGHFVGSFALNSAANHYGVNYSFTSTASSNGTVGSYGTGAHASFQTSAAPSGATSTSNGGHWTAELAIHAAADIAIHALFAPLFATPGAPVAVVVAGALSEMVGIYIYDHLINGDDFLGALKQKHSFSGVIAALDGEPFSEVITNPDHIVNMLSNLVPGGVPQSFKPYLTAAAETLTKQMRGLLDAVDGFSKNLSEGWSSFQRWVREAVSGPQQTPPKPDGGGGKRTPKGPYKPRSADHFEIGTLKKNKNGDMELKVGHKSGTDMTFIRVQPQMDSDGVPVVWVSEIEVEGAIQGLGFSKDLYYYAVKALFPNDIPKIRIRGIAADDNAKAIKNNLVPPQYRAITGISAALGGSVKHKTPHLGVAGMFSTFTPTVKPRRKRVTRSRPGSFPPNRETDRRRCPGNGQVSVANGSHTFARPRSAHQTAQCGPDTSSDH